MGIAASRSSVALLLLRIVVAKWHTRLLRAVVLVTMISCFVTTVLLFLQCKIMPSDWKQTSSDQCCWIGFTNIALTIGGMLRWALLWYLRLFSYRVSSMVCHCRPGACSPCMVYCATVAHQTKAEDHYCMWPFAGHISNFVLYFAHCSVDFPIISARLPPHRITNIGVVIIRRMPINCLRLHTNTPTSLSSLCSW
jgi:hypothetical protein